MAFTEVTGTVTRTFYNGKGAEVTETFQKNDGTEGKSRYSLWFKSEHNLNEGDTGKWRGALSVKVDEWTDQEGQTRHSAKVSLNGALHVGDSKQASQAPQDEPWAATPPAASTHTPPAGNYSDETPF
jgi:hypothetical protein